MTAGLTYWNKLKMKTETWSFGSGREYSHTKKINVPPLQSTRGLGYTDSLELQFFPNTAQTLTMTQTRRRKFNTQKLLTRKRIVEKIPETITDELEMIIKNLKTKKILEEDDDITNKQVKEVQE